MDVIRLIASDLDATLLDDQSQLYNSEMMNFGYRSAQGGKVQG